MPGSLHRRRYSSWRLAAAAVLVLAGRGDLLAHKVIPDPIVEVFLRSVGDHLTVKVWLPIAAVGDANLPRNPDGRFRQDQIQPALDVVARGIARDLELQVGDAPLPPPSVATTLSPDESFVAIDLDYPLSGGRTELSGRFHVFRGNGQIIAAQVHYVVDDQHTRTYVIDGPAERIAFAPGRFEVVRHFVNAGSEVLFEGADFLLFAICLIAAAREARTVKVALLAIVAGQALVLALSAAGLLVMSSTALTVLAGLAASTTVIVAIQDFTSPRSRWLPVLCLGFGVLSGAGVSAALIHEWAFAGSHPLTGSMAFLATVSIGEAWAIALAWSAAGLIRRRGRVAELAVLSTAIFAGHAALHRIVDQGQQLADAGTMTLDRFLVTVTIAWSGLILIAGIFATLWSGPLSDAVVGRRNVEAQ